MEIELNGAKLRVYEDGKIEKYTYNCWRCLDGFMIKGYCKMSINNKQYFRHRIVAMAFLDLDITNLTLQIDHIDRNKQNNNVSNLRIISSQKNKWNTNAKGYYWDNQKNKWHSQIRVNNITKHLGFYNTEEEANRVYLEAKKIYHII